MRNISPEKRTIAAKLKSSLKALTRATVLTATLLLSHPSAHPSNLHPVKEKSLRDRVSLVRETLKQKMTQGQLPGSKLSFSEKALAQWGNWGNWRNWNNWLNWNDWNNWRNWANWGNWGNV